VPGGMRTACQSLPADGAGQSQAHEWDMKVHEGYKPGPTSQVSRAEVLAEGTYSDRAVFPGVGVRRRPAGPDLPGGGHVVLPGSDQLDYLV
jgi:hypothetical protein